MQKINLKTLTSKLTRRELKNIMGGSGTTGCGGMCSSHSDCGLFGMCRVCVTSAPGLLGRCTGY